MNYHNLHVWSEVNPRCVRPPSFRKQFSVNVWIGVLSNNPCGPHILPPPLNGDLFHEFLENSLPDMLVGHTV